jgi:hypothetical protein
MSTEVKQDEYKNMSSLATKELSSMIEQALKLGKLDPKLLAGADKDQILELRKKLNPYGRTIKGSDEFVNLSITAISHKWWERFLVTALIGYLNRRCDEWRVPKGVPIVSVYDYIKDNTKVDIPKYTLESGDPHVIYDFQYNKEFMQKRLIVKSFLEELFQFNPDEHVRSSYSPNLDDSSRKPIASMMAEHALMHLEKIDPVFRTQKQRHDRINGTTPVKMKKITKTKKVKKIIRNKEGKVLREVFENRDYEEEIPDIEANVAEKQADEKFAKGEFYETIPPLDVFYNFERYRKENYEQLREATANLYNEKTDFEFAVNVYGSFKKEEDALAHRRQHANEVIAEIFTVPTGKWCIFDNFKEQRESVEFYNDRTAVLEAIVRQVEQDQKISASLVEKVVKKEKRKNIIEQGPDAESFAQWKAENKDVSKTGMSNFSGTSDVPDGTVEMRTWRLGKGGAELSMEKMQLLAESPKFVRDLQQQNGVTVRMPGQLGEYQAKGPAGELSAPAAPLQNQLPTIAETTP